MQLGELRLALARLLDDDGVFRGSDILDGSLNDGYQVTALLTQACEVTSSFNYNASSYVAYLTEDFFLPIRVFFNGTRLFPVRMGDLDLSVSSWLDADPGPPVYYFVHASTLWVYPRPTTTGRIKLTQAQVPQRLSADSDVPRIPTEHHQTLVQYAYAWELLKERGPLLANKAFREFMQYVGLCNDLQRTVYRRAPDRDWQLAPWDAETVARKLHSFEMPMAPPATGVEARDVAQ